jgi:CheY-like chemotaxis protein
VLIADDDPDHRFLTTRALEAADTPVDVEAVADGDAVLDYLHGREPFVDRLLPHVVFLDLRMPKRDGFEVLEHVKTHPKLSQIPVVVLTASDEPADVTAAYDRGSNAYVTKPRGRRGVQEQLRALAGYWTDKVELPEPAG